VNPIQIIVIILTCLFFILVVLHAVLALKLVPLMRGLWWRYLSFIIAILFALAGTGRTLDLFAYQSSALRISALIFWIQGLLLVYFDTFSTLKPRRKTFRFGSLWKETLKSPGVFYKVIGLAILLFYIIPTSFFGLRQAVSNPLHWKVALEYGLECCLLLNLILSTQRRVKHYSRVPLMYAAEDLSSVRSDVFVIRAYSFLINGFLNRAKLVSSVFNDHLLEQLESHPILFQGCKLRYDGSVDFELALKNMERIKENDRVRQLSLIFSAFLTSTLKLSDELTSAQHTETILTTTFQQTKELYGRYPAFLEVLRGLPDGMLDEEKIGLLSKEELETRVRERTRELEDARLVQARLLEDLKAAEANLRRIITSNADAIVIVDKNNNVRFINPAAENLFGRKSDDWLSKPFGFHLKTEEVSEFKITREKGAGVIAEMRTVEIDWEDKPAFLSSIRDITERRNLESHFRRSHKMEALGTLAGGIAHDFNNLLGVIVGNADLALLDVGDMHPSHKNLIKIRKACLRARDLVRQILTFSRQTEKELHPLKLGPILKESIQLLRASIPSNIEIRHDIDVQSDTINGDPTQINQILLNLCSNAAHAMRDEGGVLEIHLSEITLEPMDVRAFQSLYPGRYVKLTVSDSGHGIQPEITDRIFDPFFTTKRVGEGTGLGLSVVHGIVTNCGGEIEVKSELGKGTTFDLYFPLNDEAADKELSEEKRLPVGKERILFVDDERELVTALSSGLESLGYDVVPSLGPEDALDAFRANSEGFDLVITDMTMPKMTGDRLARELMKIKPEIPIILCTGYTELLNEEQAKKMGLKALIMKPILLQEMAMTIRDILGSENGKKN
jgi:signal transduction histidine kinase/ActR/RegA family two-component response regulator